MSSVENLLSAGCATEQPETASNRLARRKPFQNSLTGRPRSKLKKLECIEPLAETAEPTTAAAAPIQPAASRPIDLTLNGNLLDKEKATPLMLKRATYIIDRSLTNQRRSGRAGRFAVCGRVETSGPQSLPRIAQRKSAANSQAVRLGRSAARPHFS